MSLEVTIEDVRRMPSRSLGPSRLWFKIRVGRIVHLASSRDEAVTELARAAGLSQPISAGSSAGTT